MFSVWKLNVNKFKSTPKIRLNWLIHQKTLNNDCKLLKLLSPAHQRCLQFAQIQFILTVPYPRTAFVQALDNLCWRTGKTMCHLLIAYVCAFWLVYHPAQCYMTDLHWHELQLQGNTTVIHTCKLKSHNSETCTKGKRVWNNFRKVSGREIT